MTQLCESVPCLEAPLCFHLHTFLLSHASTNNHSVTFALICHPSMDEKSVINMKKCQLVDHQEINIYRMTTIFNILKRLKLNIENSLDLKIESFYKMEI